MVKPYPIKAHRSLGLCALMVLATALSACTDQEVTPTAQEQAPDNVAVIRIASQTVDMENIYPARTQAANNVEVRARVQGILQERSYTEGSQVKTGALLFRIDPAPFQARVQQAEADVKRAQAQLRQAQREWTRTSAMFEDNAVSARERDQAQSEVELAEAGLATVKAQLRDAQIQLGYTQVRAPIGGHAGMREVSEGNLIQPGDLLTTVRQLDPVHVVFAMPEADALAYRQHSRSSGAEGDKQKLTASLLLSNGTRYEHQGNIDFTATALDPQTGNVQARAVFSNPQGVLMPGQFVRLSLNGLKKPGTVMVPPEAIGQGPQGPMVYVVDPKNITQSRPVKLGQNTEAGQIIAEGLREGDLIIVNGVTKVKAGEPVVPIENDAKLAAGAAQ
jgi:membrane fusion protein (multidrug efflux system)